MIDAHVLAPELTDRRKQRLMDVLLRRLGSVTVVMENVSDPHNASAVLRTAEGLGISAIHVVEQPNKWEKNKAIAKSAVNSGADALKIEAGPESMYCWPQAIRKNGTAVLINASSASGHAYGRSCDKR